MIWGQLEKLKIHAFKTSKREKETDPTVIQPRLKTYTVMFNPESYSFRHENVYIKPRGINTPGRVANYSLTKSKRLSLKCLIDDSDARLWPAGDTSPLSWRKVSTTQRVEDFLALAQMVSDTHEPPYLRLEWGDLKFECRLETAAVTYILFHRDGKPMRAEINADFVEDLDPEKLAKETNRSSPDLTHQRQVKGGDTLPLMTHRIYRDPTLYIRVAQANKLNHFRKLKPKRDLQFPPIKTLN